MLLFLAAIIQMATFSLSIPIMLKHQLSKSSIAFMFVGSIIIGYSLFGVMGSASSFVVLFFLVISLYFKLRKILLSILFPTITLIFMVISDYMCGIININVFGGSSASIHTNMFYTVIYVTGIMIMTFLLSALVRILLTKLKNHDAFFRRYGLFLTILTFFTVVIFYINIWIGQSQGFSDDNIQANSILFLFYFALLIGVFVILSRTIMKEAAMQNQREQYEQLKEYTENLEHLYTDMQKFRHDYINILLSMSEYIRHKDMNQLQAYFEQKIMPISQGMQSNTYKLGALHHLKVQELKGIISAKMIKAQELHIDAIIEVTEPIEHIHMDAVPLCRCVGILLDNAIEEAIHCEAPTVHMALIRQEHGTLIVVSNSCREETPELYQLFEKGFSTKGSNRGLGLSNLREIVSQYKQVILDTQRKEGTFIQLLEVFDSSVRGTEDRIG
ncbi:accessory regulator AgrC [Paenibacillus sp. Root52]|uniref:sensor histidine kinase n=1 Tax=Paenibacillus sp. Root52 TaxID=1736552 RepID=UPI00070010E3|nr:GHKL domain-containing protein [Paenibacillus sp. Root52]KQY93538.1 accessory regulator AgrC [Paenibacillus sp. Root52]